MINISTKSMYPMATRDAFMFRIDAAWLPVMTKATVRDAVHDH